MPSKLASIQVEDDNALEKMQKDYLGTLIAPMDGMWESAVIPGGTFWEIQDQGCYAGFFCLDAEQYLLRFFLTKGYQVRAQEIFSWVISTYNIHHAIASTIEPFYFSLCLDMQKHVTLHSYLFHDFKEVEPSIDHRELSSRKAEENDFKEILSFYQRNTEGPGEWIEPFLHRRLDRGELFLFYEKQMLIATGECIPSQHQPPYADLGMVVAQLQRGKGLGSFVLIQLKKHCYANNWKPICSCAAGNLASKRAIEKAGFISEQRMVEIAFSNVDALQ